MSFASESRERVRPVLPLAGMVDILFLLLIFFMTAGAMREKEQIVEINPPESTLGEDRATPGVVIAGTSDNRLILNGREVTLGELERILTAHGRDSPGETVTLRPDQGFDIGPYARVHEIVEDAGLVFSYGVVWPESALDD